MSGKQITKKTVIDFKWIKAYEKVFREIKDAVCKLVLTGGDPRLQYYLSTDAFKTGAGGVLF